jgi:hypothetical protein
MCDYSLHSIESRLARAGEILVVHRFHSGSKGLTSPEFLQPTIKAEGFLAKLRHFFAPPPSACAVCVPDGARLILYGVQPELQNAHQFASEEPVTFRQISANEYSYRDAVEFRNGLKVRLQELVPGQMLEVLALSGETAAVESGSMLGSLKG